MAEISEDRFFETLLIILSIRIFHFDHAEGNRAFWDAGSKNNASKLGRVFHACRYRYGRY